MSKGIRRNERIPVGWMVVHGLIASAVGIGLGIVIDWFPEQGSTQAGPVDHLWDVLIWVSVPVFVTVMIVVLFSVVNFRMRPGEEELDGPPIHGNTRLEVIWTAIPAIMLVAICTYSYVVLLDIEEAKANEMTIAVTGQQFAWTYEYPQAQGKPIKSNVLVLAKGRPVHFAVKARDVIHDFWVPAFRMKIDAVPGITTRYRITPSRLGTYPVVCAELCGLGHAVMRSTARVVTPAEFDSWLAEQKAPPAAGGGEAPTGGKQPAGGGDALAAGKAVFEANGCGGCHTLADAGTSAQTGPELDKVLKGKDAAFIKESIENPSAEIAAGFQDIMPKTYGDSLSSEDLDALVKYLDEVAAK
jgi:cytochrome c oxidase subunit 2